MKGDPDVPTLHQSSIPAASPNDARQGTLPGHVATALGTEPSGTARLAVMTL
jgi:hypothetical protein